MTARFMRRASPYNLFRAHPNQPTPRASVDAACATATTSSQPQLSRGLANVRDVDKGLGELWFSSAAPRYSLPPEVSPGSQHGAAPDERTLKLGKTIQTLHDRLPTLLASPLPTEILSPRISLHLFPSTHPHLPTVNGRIAYHAALWTAPMAWGRVPVVGNVKLIILSERMVRNGSTASSSPTEAHRPEKLVVRWKTCGKTKGKGVGALYRGIGAHEQVDKITEFLGGDVRDDEEFCGLFIFEFDAEGRVVRHTIEHAEEGGAWDRMRVVSVTDWLLGKFNGRRKEEELPGLALRYCETGRDGMRRFPSDRRRDGERVDWGSR